MAGISERVVNRCVVKEVGVKAIGRRGQGQGLDIRYRCNIDLVFTTSYFVKSNLLTTFTVYSVFIVPFFSHLNRK